MEKCCVLGESNQNCKREMHSDCFFCHLLVIFGFTLVSKKCKSSLSRNYSLKHLDSCVHCQELTTEWLCNFTNEKEKQKKKTIGSFKLSNRIIYAIKDSGLFVSLEEIEAEKRKIKENKEKI